MCGIDYNRFPDAFDELPCDYAGALGGHYFVGKMHHERY
jgi:hypothetical protein